MTKPKRRNDPRQRALGSSSRDKRRLASCRRLLAEINDARAVAQQTIAHLERQIRGELTPAERARDEAIDRLTGHIVLAIAEGLSADAFWQPLLPPETAATDTPAEAVIERFWAERPWPTVHCEAMLIAILHAAATMITVYWPLEKHAAVLKETGPRLELALHIECQEDRLKDVIVTMFRKER